MPPGSVSGRLFPSQQGLLSLTSLCAVRTDDGLLDASPTKHYFVELFNSTHIIAYFPSLFHNSKTLLMTPPVTVCHEVEVSFWCIISWCFPGNQRDRSTNTYRSVHASVCVLMFVWWEGSVAVLLRKTVFVINVYECVLIWAGRNVEAALWQWCNRGDDERRNNSGKEARPD